MGQVGNALWNLGAAAVEIIYYSGAKVGEQFSSAVCYVMPQPFTECLDSLEYQLEWVYWVSLAGIVCSIVATIFGAVACAFIQDPLMLTCGITAVTMSLVVPLLFLDFMRFAEEGIEIATAANRSQFQAMLAAISFKRKTQYDEACQVFINKVIKKTFLLKYICPCYLKGKAEALWAYATEVSIEEQ